MPSSSSTATTPGSSSTAATTASNSSTTTPGGNSIPIIRAYIDDFNRLLAPDDDGNIVIHGHLINMT
jgi:hypothetical protein